MDIVQQELKHLGPVCSSVSRHVPWAGDMKLLLNVTEAVSWTADSGHAPTTSPVGFIPSFQRLSDKYGLTTSTPSASVDKIRGLNWVLPKASSSSESMKKVTCSGNQMDLYDSGPQLQRPLEATWVKDGAGREVGAPDRASQGRIWEVLWHVLASTIGEPGTAIKPLQPGLRRLVPDIAQWVLEHRSV